MRIQEPSLPVEVVLHVLSQVYVEEDEVVHVAPRERDLEAPRSQPAAPLLDAQDGVVHDFRCRLHVLQDTLQGHILTGNSCFHGLAESDTHKDAHPWKAASLDQQWQHEKQA